ncbi:MAG: radical SAM protein [Desulfobacterales bacterium]|nr:radical SAM protein [Desulfobacterales bacterium]
MRVAITIWENRVSPVADSAGELLVVDVAAESIISRRHECFEDDSLFHRAGKLAELSVTTLICGAISDFYSSLVQGYGIRLVPFAQGQVDEVLNGFLSGSLENLSHDTRDHLHNGLERMQSGMTKYQYLFGPVPSRRLGRSLGLDLTPYKTCTQDCVFCQIGRTTNKTLIRKEYVPTSGVIAELDDWLKTGGKADHITLSGSGEPTLHSRFGEVLAHIRANSAIPSVLLTNGTLLNHPEVREAAAFADIVKVSLSTWDQSSYGWVNRPHPDLDFKQSIAGQKAFRDEYKGRLWIEVFLIAGMNSIPSDVAKIATLADLLRPDQVHLNTACRPPAEDFVAPLPIERMEPLCNLFRPPAECIADYKEDGCIEMQATQEAIISMLKRRPCTARDIAGAFAMHINEAPKYLERLLQEGRIRVKRTRKSLYYWAAPEKAIAPHEAK